MHLFLPLSAGYALKHIFDIDGKRGTDRFDLIYIKDHPIDVTLILYRNQKLNMLS